MKKLIGFLVAVILIIAGTYLLRTYHNNTLVSPAEQRTSPDAHQDNTQGLPDGTISPQSRCFCVQRTGDMFQPYKIVKAGSPEGCADLEYQSNGKAPWDNGILNCDDPRYVAMKQDSNALQHLAH
jgi:hypothetical protein